jgi:hypothetical protein
LVGAAVVGAIAGGLHLLRSDIGGAHTGLLLTVGAYALTVLSAAMLYHGVVVAAREQDAAAGPAPRVRSGTAYDSTAYDSTAYDETGDPAPAEGPTVYTFRRGKPVDDRSHGD